MSELTSLQSSHSSLTAEKNSQPIHLDHLELKSSFRCHDMRLRQMMPEHLQNYFNLGVIKFADRWGSIGGDYHASTCGRRILNAHHGRATESVGKSKRRSRVSTHNLLTESERKELLVLANEDAPWTWQIKTFLTALSKAREMAFNTLVSNPSRYGQEERHSLFEQLFFPITCPEIEFYREYPTPADEAEFFDSLARAISSCFGDVYDSERREKYSKRWRIKAFNGARGKAVWLKCYRKGDYFRLEVQIVNPILTDVVQENLSPVANDLTEIGRFATQILNQIEARLDYKFSEVDVGKFERVMHQLFPRAADSKRFSTFIKCIAETGAYMPTDHLKMDRVSREHHLKLLVEIGILRRHDQRRFRAEDLSIRQVKKYYYTLSPDWELQAASYLNRSNGKEN